MKEILIGIPLLFLLGACGICGNSQQPAGFDKPQFQVLEPQEQMTCDTFECINASLDTCTPSVFDTEINKTKIHAEVKGRSSTSECIVYLKLVEINPDMIPVQYQFLAQNFNGADGVCAFTDQDITDIKNGEIDQQYLLSKCEGPLKDLAQMAASNQ